MNTNPMRPDEDLTVMEAFAEGRAADDIWVINCPHCGWWSYWNEGSHAGCRHCGADLSPLTDEAITMADYWTAAPYSCDDLVPSVQQGENSRG